MDEAERQYVTALFSRYRSMDEATRVAGCCRSKLWELGRKHGLPPISRRGHRGNWKVHGL